MVVRCGIDNLAKLSMHRDFKVCLFATFGLPLIYREHAFVDVLPAHLDDIATALASVKQQRYGPPLLGTNRISGFTPLDLPFRPRPVTSRLHLPASNTERRVIGHPTLA